MSRIYLGLDNMPHLDPDPNKSDVENLKADLCFRLNTYGKYLETEIRNLWR
jgi:hypothetical protein